MLQPVTACWHFRLFQLFTSLFLATFSARPQFPPKSVDSIFFFFQKLYKADEDK